MRAIAARGSVLFAIITLASCAGPTKYPDGYTPRPWILVLDNDRFLAYPIEVAATIESEDGLHARGLFNPDAKLSRAILQSPPAGSSWQAISNFCSFASENLDHVGTEVIAVRIDDDSPAATVRLAELLSDHGLQTTTVTSPLRELQRNGEIASRFLASLPE